MTVAHLEAEMSHLEFVRWGVFLGRRAQREEMERLKAGMRR